MTCASHSTKKPLFFTQIMGLNLSDEDMAALQTRTEGWITGLQMAALSMQGRKDLSGFVRAFAGSHRYILDYLIEEVLQQQPADVQEFLLMTSVLDRFTAPLCDAVTERSDSHNVLQSLGHANLFIIPLDEPREWYRYEHLFADLLRHQLSVVSGARRVALLHERASQWYETNGLPADAMRHSLAAQDWERAATLIHNLSGDLLKHGEVKTLLFVAKQQVVAGQHSKRVHTIEPQLIGGPQTSGVPLIEPPTEDHSCLNLWASQWWEHP